MKEQKYGSRFSQAGRNSEEDGDSGDVEEDDDGSNGGGQDTEVIISSSSISSSTLSICPSPPTPTRRSHVVSNNTIGYTA